MADVLTVTGVMGMCGSIGPYYLGMPYTPACVVLNVLLTLMIITRLVRHSRTIRSALGVSTGVTGVYTTIVVILTEACTPYAVTFLMYLALSPGHWAIRVIFSRLVTKFQVRAAFPVFHALQCYGHGV